MQCEVTLGKSDPPWVTPAGCDREVKATFPRPKMHHPLKTQFSKLCFDVLVQRGCRSCSAKSLSARVTHRGSHLPGVTVK